MQLPRVLDLTTTSKGTTEKDAPQRRQPAVHLGCATGRSHGGNPDCMAHVHVEHGPDGHSWIAAAHGHMAVRHPLPQALISTSDVEGDHAVPMDAVEAAWKKANGVLFLLKDRVEVRLPGGPVRWNYGSMSKVPTLDPLWTRRGTQKITKKGAPFEISLDLRLLVNAAKALGAELADGQIPLTLQINGALDSVQVTMQAADRFNRVKKWQPANGQPVVQVAAEGCEHGSRGYLDREVDGGALVMPMRG